MGFSFLPYIEKEELKKRDLVPCPFFLHPLLQYRRRGARPNLRDKISPLAEAVVEGLISSLTALVFRVHSQAAFCAWQEWTSKQKEQAAVTVTSTQPCSDVHILHTTAPSDPADYTEYPGYEQVASSAESETLQPPLSLTSTFSERGARHTESETLQSLLLAATPSAGEKNHRPEAPQPEDSILFEDLPLQVVVGSAIRRPGEKARACTSISCDNLSPTPLPCPYSPFNFGDSTPKLLNKFAGAQSPPAPRDLSLIQEEAADR